MSTAPLSKFHEKSKKNRRSPCWYGCKKSLQSGDEFLFAARIRDTMHGVLPPVIYIYVHIVIQVIEVGIERDVENATLAMSYTHECAASIICLPSERRLSDTVKHRGPRVIQTILVSREYEWVTGPLTTSTFDIQIIVPSLDVSTTNIPRRISNILHWKFSPMSCNIRPEQRRQFLLFLPCTHFLIHTFSLCSRQYKFVYHHEYMQCSKFFLRKKYAKMWKRKYMSINFMTSPEAMKQRCRIWNFSSWYATRPRIFL